MINIFINYNTLLEITNIYTKTPAKIANLCEWVSLDIKLKENIIMASGFGKINNIVEGLIYIQISRGIALRNHNWNNSLTPSLIISGLHKEVFKDIRPVSLISSKDIRWKCSYIKSTSLLGNVLLKQKALNKKAFECVMYDEIGFITEATTSNIWVIKNRKIYTPPLKKNILAGVTRKKVFEIAS